VPGIQPADVQELLDHGAKAVVLSRGMTERLRVSGETRDFLKERRIEAHILPTTEAAELYNRLARQGPVGGCFTRVAEIRGYLASGTFKGASQMVHRRQLDLSERAH
jgi:hypothetical protein